MDKDKTFYETNSLPLASALISLGIPLDSVTKSLEGKSIFVFPRSENLDLIIESFWKRLLKIEPNAFWESVRFLKSRIYGG